MVSISLRTRLFNGAVWRLQCQRFTTEKKVFRYDSCHGKVFRICEHKSVKITTHHFGWVTYFIPALMKQQRGQCVKQQAEQMCSHVNAISKRLNKRNETTEAAAFFFTRMIIFYSAPEILVVYSVVQTERKWHK